MPASRLIVDLKLAEQKNEEYICVITYIIQKWVVCVWVCFFVSMSVSVLVWRQANIKREPNEPSEWLFLHSKITAIANMNGRHKWERKKKTLSIEFSIVFVWTRLFFFLTFSCRPFICNIFIVILYALFVHITSSFTLDTDISGRCSAKWV